MKIFSKDNLIRLAIIIFVAAIGYIAYLVLIDDSPKVEAPAESSQPEPITDNSQFTEPEDVQPPDDEEPQKNPIPAAAVLETPVVSTAFGNSPENPLKTGSTTSTACTTDPNVECFVTFKNGAQEIVFDAQTTDADGGTIWFWTGGDDVPSGTWTVTATAGDKASNVETIYVE